MKDDALQMATPSIIAPHPNTYTYSKRLAEKLVADELVNMPVCIVRPSVGTTRSNSKNKFFATVSNFSGSRHEGAAPGMGGQSERADGAVGGSRQRSDKVDARQGGE